MPWVVFIPALVMVVPLVWAVVTSNGPVQLENRVEPAWAQSQQARGLVKVEL